MTARKGGTVALLLIGPVLLLLACSEATTQLVYGEMGVLFEPVWLGGSVEGAADYPGKGDRHPIVAVSLDDPDMWFPYAPTAWPLSHQPADAQLVVCYDLDSQIVGRCQYLGAGLPAEQRAYTLTADVYTARTGERVDSVTFETRPGPCPGSITVGPNSPPRVFDDTPFDELVAWLEPFLMGGGQG